MKTTPWPPSRWNDETGTPTRYAWCCLALLTLVNTFNYTDRYAMSVLLVFIKADLRLSDTQAGILSGFAFAIAYAVAALPIARLADRWSRTSIIALSIALWSAMTAATGAARSFATLFLARTGVGIGESGCIPSGQSLITDLFVPHRRPFALAIFSAGSAFGMVLGIGVTGSLVGAVGWRGTLCLLAAPGMAIALLVKAVVRDPVRGQFDAPSRSDAPLTTGRALHALATTPSFVLLCLAGAISNIVLFGIQSWVPAFYMRSYAMPPAQVGQAIAWSMGLGGALGLFVGGYVTQALVRRDTRWSMWLSSGIHLVMLFGLFAVFAGRDATVSLRLFAAVSVLSNIHVGAMFCAKMNVADPRARAMASAIGLALTSIVGLGFGPFLIGMVSDRLAASAGAQSLRYALCALSLVNLVPAVLYFATSFVLVRDEGRIARNAML